MFPRWLTAGLAALTLTACGGGGGPATPSAAPAAGPLAGVCPATVVVQTDWFPEAEYGAYFHMLGENPAFDSGAKLVYCASVRDVAQVWVDGEPVVADGRVLGVDVPALLPQARELAVKLATDAGLDSALARR